MPRAYHTDGSAPSASQTFVFGSNKSGILGEGPAKVHVDEEQRKEASMEPQDEQD